MPNRPEPPADGRKATLVKICGLGRDADLQAAAEAGADEAGFVIAEQSPRHLETDRAIALAQAALAAGLRAWLVMQVRQTHFIADAERYQQVCARLAEASDAIGVQVHHWRPLSLRSERLHAGDRPLAGALAVGSAEDLRPAAAMTEADRLLLDAKPPKGAAYAGGHGAAFDWAVLAGWRAPKPWMLAGGLTPDTVGRAISTTRAPGVDVSSGVESAPGVKDPEKIRAFIAAAKAS